MLNLHIQQEIDILYFVELRIILQYHITQGASIS